MSEKQAAYNAGPAHPTSVERLCDALELDYAPAVYSTPALFDKAVDKITALQYALEEAQRIAALRLTDCETMAEEVEKYKGILQGERQSFVACCADLISQRDEAREWAIKLWREKQAELIVCPRCDGKGSYLVNGISRDWLETCTYCHNTGKVTK